MIRPICSQKLIISYTQILTRYEKCNFFLKISTLECHMQSLERILTLVPLAPFNVFVPNKCFDLMFKRLVK